MTRDSLLSFLFYGHMIEKRSFPINIQDQYTNKELYYDQPFMKLVKIGVKIWKSVIKECLEKYGDAVIVPLSGGLDSRAILCGLLDCLLPSEIITYTFGVPGAYDFLIGNNIAKKYGTRHCTFDLTYYDYTYKNLLDISRRVDGKTALFHHAPISLIQENIPCSAFFWSGFMGEALSGAHLPEQESLSWERAKTRFVSRNVFSRSIKLVPLGFNSEAQLPQIPWFGSEILSYDDQLDFGIRQQCYVKPLVLIEGFNYCTPFLHPKWINFILRVPRRYRRNQYLYKEILKTAHPKLFSLPTKTNNGLPLAAPVWKRVHQTGRMWLRSAAKRYMPWAKCSVSPHVNYIDFDDGLRERDDLKNVVHENIQDLISRGIIDWIDLNDIWKLHQSRQGNFADALTLLASVEICLNYSGRG